MVEHPKLKANINDTLYAPAMFLCQKFAKSQDET